MNVLLTSAGRRTYLVNYFKKALGDGGLLFASNAVMSPALKAADGYVLTPLIYDEAYIPFLLDFCKKKEIGLVVPLFDIDLPVLSRHKKEFAAKGITVAVSDQETLQCCNDKYSMFLKLWKCGLRAPETVLSLDEAYLKLDAMSLSYPLIVKPRFGMGSISVNRAYDKAELRCLYGMCKRSIQNSYLKYESMTVPEEAVVIEECREGNEYGLDVINDFDGNYVTTIVKRKLAMRAGETDEAITLGENDKEYKILKELGAKISASFGHVGNLDVDVILNLDNMAPYIIDMNARFGGGYPFSHQAGVDLPRAYLAWAKGEQANKEWFAAKPGIHAYKDMILQQY